MKFCSKLIIALLLFQTAAYSADLIPWFPRDKELLGEASYRYQHSNKIDTTSGLVELDHNDHFLDLGISLSPEPSWYAAIHGSVAYSSNDLYLNEFQVALVHLWLNDVVGDPVSLCTGAAIRIPSAHSLKNMSSPHYGNIEMLGICSIGKEFSTTESWSSRCWGTLYVGAANRGSPWATALLAWEKNFANQTLWRLYAEGLYGFGKKEISLNNFDGYGSIQHRAIDLGLRYTHIFPINGNLFLDYKFRPYARDYPRGNHILSVNFQFPIGLKNPFGS